MKVRKVYCFRISKEAGFAEDKDGNPAECFLKLGVSLKEPMGVMTSEEREKEKGRIHEAAAGLLKIDPSLLTVISKKEYRTETKKPVRYTQI